MADADRLRLPGHGPADGDRRVPRRARSSGARARWRRRCPLHHSRSWRPRATSASRSRSSSGTTAATARSATRCSRPTSRSLGTDASAIDLPRVAEGFGCIGARAESLDHVQDARRHGARRAGADADRGHSADDGGSRPMAEQARGAVAAGHPAGGRRRAAHPRGGWKRRRCRVAGAFCAFVVEPNNAGPARLRPPDGVVAGRAALPDGRPRPARAGGGDAPTSSRSSRTSRRARSSGRPWSNRASDHGALATGVPGAVAGLCAAHERAGRLPLAQVVEPAIELGSGRAPRRLAPRADRRSSASPTSARSRPLPRTSCERRPTAASTTGGAAGRLDSALAATLRRIAREGSAGFHGGPVAAAIERDVARPDGILTAADIAAYAPARRLARSRPAIAGRLLSTAEDDVGHLVFGLLVALRPAGARARVGRRAAPARRGRSVTPSPTRMSWSGDPGGRARAQRCAPQPVLRRLARSRRSSSTGPRHARSQPASPLADDRPAAAAGHAGHDAGRRRRRRGRHGGRDHDDRPGLRRPRLGARGRRDAEQRDGRTSIRGPGVVNSIAPGRMPLFGVPGDDRGRGRPRRARLRRLRRLPHH